VQPRLVLHMFFPVTAAISLALFTDLAKASPVTTISITGGTLTASLDPLPPLDGATTSVGLSGVTAPSDATVIGAGYTITFSNFQNVMPSSCVGDEGIVSSTDVNNTCHVVPVEGASGNWMGNYLSTGGPTAAGLGSSGTITITFTSPQTSLELLWGSIDGCNTSTSCTPATPAYPGNSLALNNGITLTGYGLESDLLNAGFTNNGNQAFGGSAWVVIDATTPFTTVTLTSLQSSFESAGFAAASVPIDVTPEPVSVFLVGTGLGFAALLRRSTLGKRVQR
jgi:hypothetical protein